MTIFKNGLGNPVIRISVPWVVEILDELDLVRRSDLELPPRSRRANLYALQVKLQELFNNSVFKPYLNTCYQKAVELEGLLTKVTTIDSETIDKEIDNLTERQIIIKVSDFKTIFLAELSAAPIFLILPQDNYNMPLLVENGVGLFPEGMTSKVSETHADAMEAGKALAYNLPTSCGFHVFRVTESVLKRYWDHFAGIDKRPRLETIGNYAKELEKKWIW